MSDLVELFKKQVSLYGIGRFKPLLVDRNDELNGQDDDSHGSDGTLPLNHSDDESVDNLSDSNFSAGENDDDKFLNSSSDDDSESGDESVEGSVIGAGRDAFDGHNSIHLHDPPIFASKHCPPFESIENTLYGECDCDDFGMEVCGQTDEFNFFAVLSLGEEYNISLNSVNSLDRLASNLLRKRLYKLLFHATDFGILEKKERRKLPNCVFARIRQIYPSTSGDYMGYREN